MCVISRCAWFLYMWGIYGNNILQTVADKHKETSTHEHVVVVETKSKSKNYVNNKYLR